MQSPKRQFNKNMKRVGIFIACYFVVALIISTLLLLYTNIPQWLNGLVIVVSAGVFYLIFLLICGKIDKKKAEKQNEILKNNDPFSE